MTTRKNSRLKYKEFNQILYLFKRLQNNQNANYEISTNKDGIKQNTYIRRQTKVRQSCPCAQLIKHYVVKTYRRVDV
jgi:hypothetical protein